MSHRNWYVSCFSLKRRSLFPWGMVRVGTESSVVSFGVPPLRHILTIMGGIRMQKHRPTPLIVVLAVWTAALALAIGIPNLASAQSSPVDLADLSLAELMEVEMMDDSTTTERGYRIGDERMHFGYQYVRVKFEGYLDGTDSLSNGELLGPPSNNIFPVLPTEIVQEAHVFEFSYDVLDKTSISLLVPYLKQSTEHISTVPTYESFDITSDGLGDIALAVSRRVWNSSKHSLLGNLGISFPTGSIDEEGDTPRDTGPPVEQLPYTMQLGSGTYDIMLSLSYTGGGHKLNSANWLGPMRWGASAWGKIRTGKNSRDYRLGNYFIISTWLKVNPLEWVEPSVKTSAHLWGSIKGEDTEITLGPGVYPAPVTDPDNFGGEKVLLLAGLNFTWPKGFMEGVVEEIFKNQHFEFEFGVPVYQSLNGPQPEEDWRLSLVWGVTL